MTIQVADFTTTDTDITGGHVGIRANILVQFCHEALAECHDFAVRLALGIKVGTTLAAADGQAGEGVLEDLLKAQELDDAQIDGGVQTQTALVGADGTVELNPVAVVHLNLTLVIHPRNPEQDAALGSGQPLQQGVALVGILVLFDNGTKRFQNFINRLIELGLVGILSFDPRQNIVYIAHKQMSSLGR